jgi:hypothetical protein
MQSQLAGKTSWRDKLINLEDNRQLIENFLEFFGSFFLN